MIQEFIFSDPTVLFLWWQEKRYDIKITSFAEFEGNRELFVKLVNYAKEYFL